MFIKDTIGAIQSKCFIASYYIEKYQNDSAYFNYLKAQKLSEKYKGKPFLGSILLNKAELLTYQKDFAGAETLATQALRIGNERNNNSLVYECNLVLGKALKGMNQDKEAMNYYLKALKNTDDLKADYQYLVLKAQIYNYIALLYQKQDNYKESIKYVEKALCLEDFKAKNITRYVYLLNTLAYSKFKLNDNSCLELFNTTLELGDSLQNIPTQLTARLHLSEYYLSKKKTASAKSFAEAARMMSHQNEVFEDELEALELLAKIDPSHASDYNKRYIVLNDSLQNVERATRNKFARIEFETDEITNEKNIAEAENEKMAMQRWMIIAFGLSFIVLIILFYVSRLQRAKNRELRYLQQQQMANAEIYQLMLDQQQKIEEGKQIEKRRIAKELHDGIMGKLSAIRLNLFVLSKANNPETIARCSEYIDEIQNVEKEVRKISHDLSQNLFAHVSDFTLMVTNLMEAAKGHSQLQFKLIIDEKIDWNSVPSVVKMQVYRILQEALHNIQKYSEAKSVCIRITREDDLLTISVADDGVGFDPKTIKPGIGHKNMRERAAEINAELAIWSEVGKGTQIDLKIVT
ncbi:MULTISPECIES: tetratricopeptide repeat-containing sensor histidine kinase [Flavobacterium]|uniref:tetratricopeptide repeat-containing sensor histidine kinase n=1 Tax=Flavobacterium TaxID=237 RepID=UPI001FCA60FB|nr:MULTISPECIES: ATP-binding protein [Flavobacterium]UOK43075.1 histidine kinase [Flavobacterium enshiense]